MTWPFGHLQMFGYNIILADPPWSFENWSEAGEDRNPNQHYDTMTAEEIISLPVGQLASKDCAMFLWCVDPLLDCGIVTLKHWGFRYVTVAFTWAKCTKDGAGYPIGTGYYTRASNDVAKIVAWQDISTAPKDGQWMLISGPHVRPVQACWNDAAEQWQRFNCCDRGLEPTHWMPLPLPPKIGETE